MSVKDITGVKFGSLTVVSLKDTNKGYARWICLCDCGINTIVLGTHLRSGNTRSCGCLQKTTAKVLRTKHGGHGSKTYEAWQNMIRRCEPKGRHHSKGIKVCYSWKSSYVEFVKDMGEQPSGYSLERINPFGDYVKSNCEWIPKSENTIDTYRGRLTKRGLSKTKTLRKG